jgi:hypothetical protein
MPLTHRRHVPILFFFILAACGGSGGGGDSSTGTVTVAEVRLTGPSSLFEGQTSQAVATAVDASGQTLSGRAITWSTSDPTVATVSTVGLVTGVAAGNATISAASEGKTAGSPVTVTRDPAPASITLTPASSSIAAGGAQQLTVEVKNSRGQVITPALTFSSSANAIAIVSTVGRVTSMGPVGSANISASAGTLTSAPAAITVTPGPSASVAKSVDVPAADTVGKSYVVAVKVSDAYGNAVAGATATFSVQSGGGSITPSAITGSDGVASATFTVGHTPGTNVAVASVGSLTGVSFSATTSSGAASKAKIQAGDQQTAAAGTAVATSPAVLVTDSYGNPVRGVNVYFSTAADGQGQLAVIPTGADGIAKFDRPWTLSTTPGPNYFYANVDTMAQIIFTATGT